MQMHCLVGSTVQFGYPSSLVPSDCDKKNLISRFLITLRAGREKLKNNSILNLSKWNFAY